MWFSMRLLRSLSPSPSNTTWRENNVKRRISTRFLFVAKLSLRNASFIENGIKFKFSGFVRFCKGWKIAMFNDFKAQGLVRIHAYTVGWWQVGDNATAPKRHYRTTSWWKRGSAELTSPTAWGANSQPRLSMNPACITWFFVVISRKPYRRLYCSNSSILFWITLNILYCTHCQQARRVIK